MQFVRDERQNWRRSAIFVFCCFALGSGIVGKTAARGSLCLPVQRELRQKAPELLWSDDDDVEESGGGELSALMDAWTLFDNGRHDNAKRAFADIWRERDTLSIVVSNSVIKGMRLCRNRETTHQ